MFNVELHKSPRFLKYKKLQRGSFKVIKYKYRNNHIRNRKDTITFVAQSAGFYNWKNAVLFQKRLGRFFKQKKRVKFRFNFNLSWSFSYKTHKSRMGKGKGTVGIDHWHSRIQGGKFLIFLKSPSFPFKSILSMFKKASVILPVSVTPLFLF